MSIETWDVYVTDSGEAVVDMLHGVSSVVYGSSMQGMVMTVLALALFLVAFRFVLTGGWNGAMRWFVISVFIIFGVTLPKKPVLVQDYSDPYFSAGVVEDVPIGLAAILSFSTVIGHELVKTYESAFGTVEGNFGHTSFQYSVGGMLAGERTLQSLLLADAEDPRVISNVNGFLNNCVFPEAIRDEDFAQIAKSGELLTLFSANTSTELVSYRKKGQQSTFVKCSDIAPDIISDIEEEAEATIRRVGKINYPDLSKAEAASAYSLDAGFVAERYLGLSMDGPEMISQVLAINLIRRSTNGRANTGGDAAIMEMVNAQAMVQSRMTMSSIGSLMKTALPKMHAVFVVVLIALFPIIVTISLVPGGGGGTLKFYFLFFVNLQVWPLLFSIFSRIVQGETIDKAKAMTKAADPTVSADPRLDMTILDPLIMLPSETSSIALMMIGLIPGISVMITKGYSAVSSQMESTLRPITSATENAASSGATGNISMGNTNLQNRSVRNASEGQINTSPNVNAGLFYGKTADGGNYMTTKNGETVVNAQPSFGRSVVSGDMGKMYSNAINERRSEAETVRDTASEGYSKSIGAAQIDALAGAYAENNGISWDRNFGYDISDTSRDAINKTLRGVERYAEDQGLSAAEEFRTFMGARAEVSVGGRTPGPVQVGGSISGYSGAEKQSSERGQTLISDYLGLEGNHQQSEDFARAMQEIQSNRERTNAGNSSSLSKSMNSNLREAESYSSDMVRANNQISSYDRALNQDESHRANMIQDLNGEMQRVVMEAYPEEGLEILGSRGDDRAIQIQRNAFEKIVDEYIDDGTFKTFSGAEMGMPKRDSFEYSGEDAREKYSQGLQDVRDFSNTNSALNSDQQDALMSSEEMRENNVSFHTRGQEFKEVVQKASGGDINEVERASDIYSQFTPDGRNEDLERYNSEIAEVYDNQPMVTKEVAPVHFGNNMPMRKVQRVKDTPTPEELQQVKPPTTGSLREELEPASRGPGGQTEGLGMNRREDNR